MIFPGPKEFSRLAQQGNLVPVWTVIPADLLTPVSAYLKLTQREAKRQPEKNYSFLLESVEGGETIARYTYLGADPFTILRYWLPGAGKQSNGGQGTVEITENGRTRRFAGELMTIARRMVGAFRPVRVAELPPLTAGAVGYLGYDLVTQFEPVPLPSEQSRQQPMPDAVLAFYATLLAFDHVKQQIVIVRNVQCLDGTPAKALSAAYSTAEREIREIERRLQAPLPLGTHFGASAKVRSVASAKSVRATDSRDYIDSIPVASSFQSNFKREEFLARVCKAKDYIRAGDVFQVVLSQRLERRIGTEPFDIYRALRQVNPAPYLFFLRMGEDAVVGSSPEMLVKVTGEDVEYRPIAGTRRRGRDPAEDQALERELLADEKERAEHVMLVDLGRNDVGRVCRFGTVEVPNFMFIERYSHVMHLVSSVRGKLRPGVDAWDTLAACFPAGTVTGAPKVRAMQIISELEPTRRGVYAGSILYFDFAGNLNSCIAIRTMVIRDGKAYVQVGAGIVADSVPEREFEETLSKGRALLQAVEIAEERSGQAKRGGTKAGSGAKVRSTRKTKGAKKASSGGPPQSSKKGRRR